MKFIYYVRVFILSFEFLALIFVLALYLFLNDIFTTIFNSIKINDEALKWLISYHIGIAVWILKDGTTILFPDEKTNRALHEWPEYWKLKAHFDVGIFYCISSTAICLSICFFEGIKTINGAWFFSACTISLSLSAYSFYVAKIKLKSALIHLSN